MRAIVVSQLGAPDVLVPTEVGAPVAGDGQVLIDVAFANITFVETQIRAGRAPNPAMVPPLPYIPGNGVGGTTGDGRRVVTATGGRGAYAEQVAADAAALVPVPPALDLDVAVALLADGRTALMLAEAAAIAPGDVVVVHAAAGGVGWLLMQLARQAGAGTVIGAAGSERKLARVRELADVAVDYTRPGWTREAGAADVVFDGVGGRVGREALDLVREGGRFVAFGFASGDFTGPDRDRAAARGVSLPTFGPPSAGESRELTRRALELAAGGRLGPLIGQRFPLEQAAEAHRRIEAREAIGKTLLVVGGGR